MDRELPLRMYPSITGSRSSYVKSQFVDVQRAGRPSTHIFSYGVSWTVKNHSGGMLHQIKESPYALLSAVV